MLVIPEHYVSQIFYQHVTHSSYNKTTRTYNGSCPFCKEGKSYGRKKRFFYIPNDNYVFCHNCGYSKNVISFIIDVTGQSYREVMVDIEENGYDDVKYINFDENQEDKKESPTLPEDCINLFDKNQVLYYKDEKIIKEALKYIKSRRLHKAINRPLAFYVSLKDFTHKNRLILPFYDIDKKIIFYQSRTILDSDKFTKPNYISKVNGNKSLYGIHNIDLSNNYVYLLEGPIDSFFVKNGLAVGGIQDRSEKTMTSFQQQQLTALLTHEKVWVLDNQHVDDAARKKTEILLELGERVFIWPESLKKYKDVNDYCVDKGVNEFDQKIILDNTYQGLEGYVVLQNIKDY